MGVSLKIYLALGFCKVCILIIGKICCTFYRDWRRLYQAAGLEETVRFVVKRAEKFGDTVGVAWYRMEFTYSR
jgi:hypothetical protein